MAVVADSGSCCSAEGSEIWYLAERECPKVENGSIGSKAIIGRSAHLS